MAKRVGSVGRVGQVGPGGRGQGAPGIDPRTPRLQTRSVGLPGLTTRFMPGIIMSFSYLFWRHDPRPLVLASKYVPKYGANLRENLLAGFNIHYVPMHMVRAFIRAHVWQVAVATQAALRHPILKKSYRTYKIGGITQARKLDYRSFIENVDSLNKLSPAERENLILSIEAQIASNPRDITSVNRLVARFLQQRQAPGPVIRGPQE